MAKTNGIAHTCAYCGYEWRSKWANVPSRNCPNCGRVRVVLDGAAASPNTPAGGDE